MIQVDHLSVRYQEQPALKDICLQVRAGESVLITGPSGCGKSTLARAICGIIPHALFAEMEGTVRVAGLDTRTATLPGLAQRVGMVFQNPGSQLFHLQVSDEIAFGPRNLGLDEQEVRERVAWALEATGLVELGGRRPAELSGGQKQCVAIAAVLAMHPQVLVLDEPTASLDLPNTFKVFETLKQLRERLGITVLIIEHRLAAAAQQADRIVLMDQGEIVDEGSPQKLLLDRQWREVLGLRRPVEQPMTPWKNLILPNGKPRPQQVPLLRLEGVAAGYRRQEVIQDIHLSIYPGDFIALVGPNGAGKSTLAMVIAGLLKPKRGKIYFRQGTRPQAGRDVTLLFQNVADQLFTDSVDEEVAFAPRNYRCFQEEVHLNILREADLLALRDRRPITLSVGQQQRAALAACLALRPKLVILDEPTLGQDWGHLQQLMNFLRTLNDGGTAVLLITHDYKLVHHYARRIILLENGRVKLLGNIDKDQRVKGDINEIQYT